MPTVAVPTGPQSEASDIGWSSLLFLPSTSAYPGEIDLGKPRLEIRKTAGGAQEVEAYSRLCGCEDALTRGPRPGGRGPPPTLQTS